MVADHYEKPIASFRFRLGCVLALRECLRWSFAWIMLWATALVAARAIFRIDQPVLLWGAVGLAGVLASACFWASGNSPSPKPSARFSIGTIAWAGC